MSDDTLNILVSFDCSWGIGGPKRHCSVHVPCMTHRLADTRAEKDRLLEAVKDHHQQKADDRCWMDDNKLYAAAGLPVADVTIESCSAMLKNCERFVELRMLSKEGSWKSYAELESDLAEAVGALKEMVDERDIPDANCSCHISPPCNDCVDYGHARELAAGAARIVAKHQGQPDKPLTGE